MTDTVLIELIGDDLAAMLRGEASIRGTLAVPPGGGDDPAVLEHVRTILAGLVRDEFPGHHWMMVCDGEIVGLCGIKHPPSSSGEVEIGYGVAASRRRRGHATRAIARPIEVVRGEPGIRRIVAETLIENVASQRVLEKNGFERSGERVDPEDCELVIWGRPL